MTNHSHKRRDFGFIGRLCLDFAQTGDMGWGVRYERLTSAGELARWLSLCDLRLDVRATAPNLGRARALRRAIWRIAVAVVEGKAPAVRDVRAVNATAGEPALARALDASATSSAWHRPSVDRALATIAQDAVALFGDATLRTRVRRCANSQCRVIFYDDSRPGLRRWCAPNRCGDRIRARDYRERQRTQSGEK